MTYLVGRRVLLLCVISLAVMAYFYVHPHLETVWRLQDDTGSSKYYFTSETKCLAKALPVKQCPALALTQTCVPDTITLEGWSLQ
jgi:hypothetical protein